MTTRSIAVIDTESGELTQFKPERALARDIAADAGIEYAAKVMDFEAMERDIDRKIDNIEELVGWWDANVRSAGKPKKNLRRSAQISYEEAEGLTKFSHQQVSKYRRWTARRMEFRAAIKTAAMKRALGGDQGYRAEGTGENEWYTPGRYVELARKCMGQIDLDPASCKEAQKVIRAEAFFTRDDDGLSREWWGRVWLNPPFSRDLIAKFTVKLADEYGAGRVEQAILLTHNNTDTEWFHALAYVSSALCFTRGRIPFYRGDWVASPPNGQVFFYLGRDTPAFESVFSAVGLVVVPRAA